jgi:thiol:disulfide interchange protein DsbA
MAIKKITMLLISLVLLSFPVQAEENPSIKGVYTRIPGHEFKFDGKQVEIIEFFSFYCSHCYEFGKSIPVIKGNFPKKIKWKTVPIYWGKGSPNPGQAYFLAEEAGKGEQMRKAIFKAFFVEKRDIGNVKVLEDIGIRLGLGFDFSRRLRAGEKAGDVGEAILMSKKYDINETPSLIIAGNLKINPGMLDHNIDFLRDNAITILKSIFKK